MLSFDHTEEIKKIYQIEYLQHMRVKIEALRNSKSIPQCKRCQSFGHTQKFCQRQAKCVKCAGNHMTAECNKNENFKPVCANCNEAHPANYRGCLVAKELQKRRLNKNKPKQPILTKPAKAKVINQATSSKVVQGVLFSQALKSKSDTCINSERASKSKALHTKLDDNEVMHFMQNLLQKIDEISMRLNKIENGQRFLHIETPKRSYKNLYR